MYGYPCEYCEGVVRPKRVAMESFKHRNGFVILEDVTLGVCDSCGNRYYSAEILKAIEEVASGKKAPLRTAEVPVARVA